MPFHFLIFSIRAHKVILQLRSTFFGIFLSRMSKISTYFGFRMVGLVGQLSITDKTGQDEINSKISFKVFEKSCAVNFNQDCLEGEV